MATGRKHGFDTLIIISRGKKLANGTDQENMQEKTNLLIMLTVGISLANSSFATVAPADVPTPATEKVFNPSGTISSAQSPSPRNMSTNALAQQSCDPAKGDPESYHGLPPETPEVLTPNPKSFWQRNTMLDDAWNARSFLNHHGLRFEPAYIGEVFGNVSGGAKQGAVYDHVLDLPLTVYLDKIASWWNGGTIHANALWIAGRSLSSDKVGDISGASNIAGYPTVRLQELWFEQELGQMCASLRIGLLAADTEFFASDTASLFINGTFGAFTLVGANLPDPPVYPMAAPGARFRIQPVPQFYFQTGVYAGTTEDQDVNKNGTAFRLNSSDGALIFAETGYLLNQSPSDHGLAGNYKIGSFVHTAGFNNWNSGTSEGADFGIYAVADQEIYCSGGRSASCFVRGGGGQSQVNMIDWYFDAGFNFSGFIPGRDSDVAGIAVAHSSFSHNFSGAQVADGSNPFTSETVIEATYKIQVLPWWVLQPDCQYIFNPGGEQNENDSIIIGLRTAIVF